ncbi:MAG: GH36 C-terminal domain-containing protein, partial [Bacteroidaceae bacterium]|nr:GH36 C-terminal domain-containing protein [Bacteroidaceae bacterium]
EKELAYAKNAVATYKEIRPIIQQGNQYRILSPYDKTGYASELYITDDKSEAVFFAYKFEHYLNQARPRFLFAGLNPDATYRLTELCRNGNADHWEGHTFTGKFLMQQGVEIALNGLFASKVIRLTKQ